MSPRSTGRGCPAYLLGLLVLLAALLVPARQLAAQSKDVAVRRVGHHFRDGVPHASFSARDLVDADARRKLESGLPKTIQVTVLAYRERGGAPLAATARSCRVTYDLWEQVYRVEVQDVERDRSRRLSSMAEVLDTCLVVRKLPVGKPEDFARHKRRKIYLAVLVEFNPISPDTVQKIRRWIARPVGGGSVQGGAFFGSFVSLFVNRRIGDADRQLRFRSPPFSVP